MGESEQAQEGKDGARPAGQTFGIILFFSAKCTTPCTSTAREGSGDDAVATQLGVMGVRWDAIPPRTTLSKTVRHAVWALNMEGWRKCEAHYAQCDSTNTVIRCEVEWQRWLERQEERCHDDTSAAGFFILDDGDPIGAIFKLVNCLGPLGRNG